MPVSFYPLEELIPHRDAMVLIDRVVEFNEAERSLVVEFKPRQEWMRAYAAIEYMAQSAAALAGYFDKLAGEKAARPGFLLGTRKLSLAIDAFDREKTYRVKVMNEFADSSAASFSCEIMDGEEVVASATLNAYRPESLSEFLKTSN